MATHKISVTVDNATIQVVPETLVMTAVDDVHWAGTNEREFSIVFDNDAAFGRREMEHAVAKTPQRARAQGRFKYTVVSAEDRNVMLDPVIIVEEPPTKPKP